MKNLPDGRTIAGAGVAPIQNTRYLDSSFVGVSTGSIAAPYSSLVPFFAEIAGSDEAWELWVAPISSSLTETVPAIAGALVVRGINPIWTFDTNWTIAPQVDGPSFDFYDLDASLALQGGASEFAFTRCAIGAITSDPSSSGVAFFYDCNSRDCLLPTNGFVFRVVGGSMTGDCSWSTGRFQNVAFGDNFTFAPGAGDSLFTGCVFGTGGTISNANAPTLIMDAFSYANFVLASVTFGGNVVVPGVVRGVTGQASVNVPANSSAFEDFAAPGMTAAHRVVVNVNNTPPAGIGIGAIWPTPGANNFRVWFTNSTASPVALSGFSLSYWATL